VHKVLLSALLLAISTLSITLISAGRVTAQTVPAQIDCRGALNPRLGVGVQGAVIPQPPIPLRVHSQPGANSPVVGQLAPGARFTVIGGPQCIAGSVWWQIQSDSGLSGWIAEGQADQGVYFVEPLSQITPIAGNANEGLVA